MQLHAEHKTMIAALKAEKVKALDEGDSQRVVEIDEQLLTAPPQQDMPVHDNAEADRMINGWKEQNTWYQKDSGLTRHADMMSRDLAARGIPLEVALQTIEAEVKDLFPHKFQNKQREAPPSVEGGGTPQSKSGKVSEKSLRPAELAVYRDLGLDKVLTTDAKKQEYFKNVIESREKP